MKETAYGGLEPISVCMANGLQATFGFVPMLSVGLGMLRAYYFFALNEQFLFSESSFSYESLRAC